ncbi:LacI family DNA-binding transcriptional regulator [Paracoccus sediminis]|uniref:LacI family DNA-binding transcriptional regulator n=1 Tax=Paracoccus sediminis TaxID=1214787 RepID=A0A238WP67_9RHOB|nr:LacI family DNA-binding transcriptional regulator [Paracoccus sediminis]TBN50423.1 LacI family DNA-binding transcriptional regulator [Paracoccus sediminis]SNR48325.1 transcriptional regulator, LacI family [Paracoccus sediminis]
MAKVTLEDVARTAGVSVATVDRVVNRRGGVSADKETAILHTARQLGLDRNLTVRPTTAKRIAILIQPPSNPFHDQLRRGLDQARAIHRDLNLLFQIEQIDPTRPDRVAARIARAGTWADGMILTVPASPQVVTAIEALPSRIPVVTMADDVPTARRAAFVGPDDRQSGRVAGDLMGYLIGPAGGEALVLIGRFDMPGHGARGGGFIDVLAERHPAIRVTDVLETHEDKATAAAMALRAARANPDLHGIYLCTTGCSELVAALAPLRQSRPIAILTHELTPERRIMLRDRKVQAIIDQKPMLEARLAVETVARLVGRLDGDAGSIATEIQIVMPESV